jgi:thiol-disulfide isomerase/thioredoxin
VDNDARHQPPVEQQRSVAFSAMMVLLVVAVGLLLIARARQPKLPNEWAGQPLPPLEAAGWLNTERPLAADALRGKVVLLDFWMTSCGPCVAGIPELASLHERFREHGVVIVGLTSELDSDVGLKRFVESRPGMEWPIGYGAASAFSSMGIYAVPTYVVYDRTGRSVWGGHSLDGAEEAIVAALAKKGQELRVERQEPEAIAQE